MNSKTASASKKASKGHSGSHKSEKVSKWSSDEDDEGGKGSKSPIVITFKPDKVRTVSIKAVEGSNSSDKSPVLSSVGGPLDLEKESPQGFSSSKSAPETTSSSHKVKVSNSFAVP